MVSFVLKAFGLVGSLFSSKSLVKDIDSGMQHVAQNGIVGTLLTKPKPKDESEILKPRFKTKD